MLQLVYSIVKATSIGLCLSWPVNNILSVFLWDICMTDAVMTYVCLCDICRTVAVLAYPCLSVSVISVMTVTVLTYPCCLSM